MQNAALVITRIRRFLSLFLPRSWLKAPIAHDEGLYPKRPTPADIEIEPGDPASSWVAWETSSRRKPRRGRTAAEGDESNEVR
ncbi:MAG: hypothetical protein ACR2QU_08225 [Gammaproteobacteria bacterium]